MAATLNLAPLLDKMSLEELPFDIFNLLGPYLLPSELAKVCLVSRHLNESFRPLLYRHWRFDWPPKNMTGRYNGQALLNLDFDKHLRSLELEIWGRRGANCSWPIAMRKKQRSILLKRLKSCSSLTSLSLTSVFPRSYAEATRLYWFPTMVDGFKNLKSLTLCGAEFGDPSAASSLILASPGLKKLEICELDQHCGGSVGMSAEKVTNFWTQVIRTIRDRPFGSDTAGIEGDRGAFLKLTEFAVDEIANVNFSTLTDLSTLRTLTLHYSKPWRYMSEAPPSCAKYFIAATGLCSLRVHFYTIDTDDLVFSLWSIPSPCLKSLKMSGWHSKSSTLLQSIPNLPWRDLDVMTTSVWPDVIPLRILGSEEYASTLERFSFCWHLGQGDHLAETIKPCPNLRVYTICKVKSYHRAYEEVSTEGLATHAAQIFLNHEAHLKAQQLASKLQQITFVHRVESRESFMKGSFLHSRRVVEWRETAFHKTWDPRKGISVQGLKDLPPEAAGCQWRLWVRIRTLPRYRDQVWYAPVE